MQRIDIINLLSNNSVTSQTPVTISFASPNQPPCFTTTVNFQNAITLWAGANQACVNKINDISITPLPTSPGQDVAYSSPTEITVNSNYYLTQIVISQKSPPIYDSANGVLITSGEAQSTVSNYVTGPNFIDAANLR
jgi:hypothetical protein